MSGRDEVHGRALGQAHQGRFWPLRASQRPLCHSFRLPVERDLYPKHNGYRHLRPVAGAGAAQVTTHRATG
jgi:hypothetical protein